MLVVNDFKDYEIIDASNGEKYERWKNYYFLRPDPQIIWDNGNLREKYKGKIDAIYNRSKTGGGYWENLRPTKEHFSVTYRDLIFEIKQMGFKHTGLFPEQASNWSYMMEKIRNANREIKVLNLFAYTGGATVACLKAGASVNHVDSSRGMVDWCKENVKKNGLENSDIHYYVDDVVKFVKREIRRGHKYDAIIMDPPSYGRGANKEVWNIEKDLFSLVTLCKELLSDKPLFFLINSYTAGLSPKVLENIFKITFKDYKGIIDCGEIGLPITKNDLVLPCGIYGRWSEE